jgi:methyl-accepting chemotaxis protein
MPTAQPTREQAPSDPEKVLERIHGVTVHSETVASSIEQTSAKLEAVDQAAHEIDESVAAQRTATGDSQQTLSAVTGRLVQITLDP